MIQPGRKYSATEGYRYGFNGKENDNDVKGEGNQQDYGMRIYDPSLGRFLSVDPLQKQFPELSTYQFSANTPIQAIDLDGLETVYHYQLNEKNKPALVGGFNSAIEKTGPLNEYKFTLAADGKTYSSGRYSSFQEGYQALSQAAVVSFMFKDDKTIEEINSDWDKQNAEWESLALAYWSHSPETIANGYLAMTVPVMWETQGAAYSKVAGGQSNTAAINKQSTRINNSNTSAAESNTAGNPQSKFLGGAKGDLYSKQKILEGNHAPTMQSYEIAGFKITYNKGSAFQMLYEEHQRFISSGNSKVALAFRNQEASLLKQGKFMEAFELTARQVKKSYGNKYDEAIQEARTYYQINIVPQLQKQIATKTATTPH
jgi:RHS repeat-associated protein